MIQLDAPPPAPRRRGTLCCGPWVAVLVAGLAVGCAPGPTTSMVSIPPPHHWEETLASYRVARDERFRIDPDTPLRAVDLERFEGLTYWPPDPGYYFVGSIRAYEQPERFTIIATSGQPRPCERVGWVDFRLDGQPLALQVYRLLDVEPQEGGAGYFLPFMDATTGTETYPAGRYVELEGPPGGPFVLDFNRATNPLCAYGAPERFACPVTPPENRLPVPVAAGERGFVHRAEG